MEVGQHFSGQKAPGDKHNTAQLRSEVERCACVAADLTLGIEMSQDIHSCLSV